MYGSFEDNSHDSTFSSQSKCSPKHFHLLHRSECWPPNSAFAALPDEDDVGSAPGQFVVNIGEHSR